VTISDPVAAFLAPNRRDQATLARVEIAESLLASSPCLIVDEQGFILFATGQVEFLLGYVSGELVGHSVHELVPLELRDRHREHFAGFWRDPSIRPMGARIPKLRGVRRDGTEIEVAIGLSPFARDGKRYCIATVLDLRKTAT
jgi:PAS domain S-box-containing protein